MEAEKEKDVKIQSVSHGADGRQRNYETTGSQISGPGKAGRQEAERQEAPGKQPGAEGSPVESI